MQKINQSIFLYFPSRSTLFADFQILRFSLYLDILIFSKQDSKPEIDTAWPDAKGFLPKQLLYSKILKHILRSRIPSYNRLLSRPLLKIEVPFTDLPVKFKVRPCFPEDNFSKWARIMILTILMNSTWSSQDLICHFELFSFPSHS